MRLPDFKVEQWMNDYENDAIYNLTDTCVKALTLQELLDLESLDFKSLTLDYGQITGDIDLKKAILTLYKHGTVDNVTTAQGCLQANELVMNTLLEKKRMKLSQLFLAISSLSIFLDQLDVRFMKSNCMKVIGKWTLNLLKQYINSNTKMIILNNPSNPTGTGVFKTISDASY